MLDAADSERLQQLNQQADDAVDLPVRQEPRGRRRSRNDRSTRTAVEPGPRLRGASPARTTWSRSSATPTVPASDRSPDYVPPVADGTASQASLRSNHVLGQDAYGALLDVQLKGATLSRPRPRRRPAGRDRRPRSSPPWSGSLALDAGVAPDARPRRWSPATTSSPTPRTRSPRPSPPAPARRRRTQRRADHRLGCRSRAHDRRRRPGPGALVDRRRPARGAARRRAARPRLPGRPLQRQQHAGRRLRRPRAHHGAAEVVDRLHQHARDQRGLPLRLHRRRR